MPITKITHIQINVSGLENATILPRIIDIPL